jgi:predicted nucleic acid-binding protein
MIILDTNVLSEALKPSPSAKVLEWLAAQSGAQLFTTAITEAEILHGLELLPKGRRRNALSAAVDAMFEEDFGGRILPFDSAAARLFPRIAAARRSLGRPITQFDAQIAAIARARQAMLATRNSQDFQRCGIAVVDPWTAG